jgi:hypothetical protein
LLSPNASGRSFNENVMIEINIDNTGDNVEDLVIQAIKKERKCTSWTICFSSTGTSSMINTVKLLEV